MSIASTKKETRFGFGKNWGQFLTTLNEDRIRIAEESLQKGLGVTDLQGVSFLDIGSGSGIFSLAARRLGAKVRSFDYDSDSVACTQSLKDKFFPNDKNWIVEQGSILDEHYLKSLGAFDIVYSWGVLHHTGAMYKAFENVIDLVKPQGRLFISIYNDQGRASRRWTRIKKLYNESNVFVRIILAFYTLLRQWTKTFVIDFLRSFNPLKSWNAYARNRGMSPFYDLIDWVGGYPFEVAKPEEVFGFFHQRGFALNVMTTCAGGIGCNEFGFIRLGRGEVQ